jgi:hypothetical protein
MSGKSSLFVAQIPELLGVAAELARYSSEAHQESNQYVLLKGQLPEGLEDNGIFALTSRHAHPFQPFRWFCCQSPCASKNGF